jgi:hypothetical protein
MGTSRDEDDACAGEAITPDRDLMGIGGRLATDVLTNL